MIAAKIIICGAAIGAAIALVRIIYWWGYTTGEQDALRRETDYWKQQQSLINQVSMTKTDL